MVRRITKIGVVAIALALIAAKFTGRSGPTEVTTEVTEVEETTTETSETSEEDVTEE